MGGGLQKVTRAVCMSLLWAKNEQTCHDMLRDVHEFDITILIFLILRHGVHHNTLSGIEYRY